MKMQAPMRKCVWVRKASGLAVRSALARAGSVRASAASAKLQ